MNEENRPRKFCREAPDQISAHGRQQSAATGHRRVPVTAHPHREVSSTESSKTRALERHYTPTELAERWGICGKLVRLIFIGEAGVLRIDRPEQRNKRGYCSLRIPESVAIRVHRQLSKPKE